ncbi:MAG: uracil-DNA glycosylase family protein [Anaerolineales bacterium]
MHRDRASQLEAIVEQIQDLAQSPLYEYRKEHGYKPVVGEGDPDAEMIFIGEAPGAQEAKMGRPFVGNAGRVLDELLASIGIDRADVYITNVMKDRPPGNRDPHQDEIDLYARFLLRQIEIIQPRVIVTLGRFAMDFILAHYDLLQQGQKIGDLHGEVLEAETAYGEVKIVSLYHPAAAFYNQELKATMEEDIQVLAQFV